MSIENITSNKEWVFTPTNYKNVGWWVLPGGDEGCKTKFSVRRKPRWLTIKLMSLLLQWEYEDELN